MGKKIIFIWKDHSVASVWNRLGKGREERGKAVGKLIVELGKGL